MKTISLIFTALSFALTLFGQTNIQIITKDLLSRKIDKIEFFDLSQKEFYTFPYKDTLNVVFLKTNADCYNIRYHTGGKMLRQQIWLDASNIVIKAHLDTQSLVIDTVTNSPLYYEVINFGKQYAAFYKAKDTVGLNAFLLKLVEKNINNPFSLMVADYFMRTNQNSKLTLLTLRPYLEKQGDQFDWFLLSGVKERLNNLLETYKIDLNNYSFIDPKGKNIKLDTRSAEYYILDMWFLACAPCIQQHKEIKEKLALLKQHNIEMIGISTDRNQEKWQTYLSKHQYNWLNYRQDETQNLTQDWTISVFPTYIILDKTGKIIGYYNEFDAVLKYFKLT